MRLGNFAGRRIEQHDPLVYFREIEVTQNRIPQSVERLIADPRQSPVIFDEAQNRGLILHRMVHMILLRVWRDHQEWKSGSVSASVLVGSRDGGPAHAGTRERIVG